MNLRGTALVVVGAAVIVGASTPLAAASRPYLRLGLGYVESRDATVQDDNCASLVPPALFGCGPGVDGAPLAARGDFGTGPLGELAAGLELGGRWRLELVLAWRPELDLEAEANFLGVDGGQPVRAAGRSWSLMTTGSVDLGPTSWLLRPFLTGSLGAACNELSPGVYRFPSLGIDAVTLVPGGTSWHLAWSGGLGLSADLAPTSVLEVAIRYTDLGRMETAAGPATIVRTRGTLVIDIAETHAALQALEILLAWRRRL